MTAVNRSDYERFPARHFRFAQRVPSVRSPAKVSRRICTSCRNFLSFGAVWHATWKKQHGLV